MALIEVFDGKIVIPSKRVYRRFQEVFGERLERFENIRGTVDKREFVFDEARFKKFLEKKGFNPRKHTLDRFITKEYRSEGAKLVSFLRNFSGYAERERLKAEIRWKA